VPYAESSWVGGVAGDSGMPESEAEVKGGDSGRAAASCTPPCSLADLNESEPSCDTWPGGCHSCFEQQCKMQAMAQQLSRPQCDGRKGSLGYVCIRVSTRSGVAALCCAASMLLLVAKSVSAAAYTI